MEGEVIQPMQGPGYQTYPALYRSFIYFFSSPSAREQFMQSPMMYLEQESPKPVVPIRMAIIGPPKSGKTTCKYSPHNHHPARGLFIQMAISNFGSHNLGLHHNIRNKTRLRLTYLLR